MPRSVHSGSLSWGDCGWMFPDKLSVSSILEGSHTVPGSRIVSPLWLRWVKGVCVLRCNLPPALLVEWPGSFTCHYSNTEVKQTPNKSRHTKLTREKNILPPHLPEFKFATFQSRIWCCYQQAILAPHTNSTHTTNRFIASSMSQPLMSQQLYHCSTTSPLLVLSNNFTIVTPTAVLLSSVT